MRYAFTVPGDPVPSERVRVTKRGTFIPRRTLEWEGIVRWHAVKARVRPIPGPVRIVTRFYRATARRCDIDNLSKSVWDALTGTAWEDDSQIVSVVATKAVDRKSPRVEVEIEALSESEEAA